MSVEQAGHDDACPPKTPWIHPQLIEIDIRETAGINGPGGDGGQHADCSRS